MGRLQSRISARGVKIAEMEYEYALARYELATKYQQYPEIRPILNKYKRTLRAEIKPLAIEQKLDKDIRNVLNAMAVYLNGD